MTSLLTSAASAFQEENLTFPNLFGGITISYYQGFTLFGLPIYWYGVLITIGVILAYLYASRRAKSFGISPDRMFDVAFVALIGGFLGARIYYCVFINLDPAVPEHLKYNFITMFTEIRSGGLAIYGGVIGGFLFGFIMCKIRKVNFRAMADLASLGFLIGQTIGRWGNFVNQEAHGGVCDPDWIFAMKGTQIEIDGQVTELLVHPCFLYESVWCLLGFIGLHFYSKKLRTFDGEIMLMYIAWYGLGRAWIEGLRTDSLMIGQFKVSQLIAAASFVVGTALVIVFKILTEKKKIPLFVNTEAWEEQQKADLEAEEERRRKKEAKKNAEAPSILADGTEDISLDPGEDSEYDEESESEFDEDAEPDDDNAASEIETEETAADSEEITPENNDESEDE